MPALDLPMICFMVLRRRFMDSGGRPMTFALREKRNTQDDPLDEHLHRVLTEDLPDLIVQRAGGPLISPDMVVARPSEYERLLRGGEELNPSGIIGLEVKKVERQKSGGVARAAGLDYNSTPPCEKVRVYAAAGQPLDIAGFYLFVCQERIDGTKIALSALVLCTGAALNRDFEYYLSVVGSREKSIGLGTYGDGADRLRPMIIFANPLGLGRLDRAATLVHERHDLDDEFSERNHSAGVRNHHAR